MKTLLLACALLSGCVYNPKPRGTPIEPYIPPANSIWNRLPPGVTIPKASDYVVSSANRSPNFGGGPAVLVVEPKPGLMVYPGGIIQLPEGGKPGYTCITEFGTCF
jgi:hypothetical protein